MKLAIFENIMTPGGHEVDFDRIIVDEFQRLGHSVSFYVPENFSFQFDYGVPFDRLDGEAVTYSSVRGLRKIFSAAKREINRQRWYRQLFDCRAEFDALIVPTSTYRYLRAINHSKLRRLDKPIVFILHGINPTEAERFFDEARRLLPYSNVRLVVLTFGDSIFGRRLDNIFPIVPPTYTPRDIDYRPSSEPPRGALRIGFFGQYRREKKLEALLDVYLARHYSRSVELIVQGSTMHDEDSVDFDRIIDKYSNRGISFRHEGLIGADWQRAIASVDALLMPYSSPRYRYHWGGMLFTAIGYQKPVVASDDMNPEVFKRFRIGETFSSGDVDALGRVLESFINDFDQNFGSYHRALLAASEEYSPLNFARRLASIISIA